MATVAPVLVVGAGPSGLATAVCLEEEGIAFRLVDRRGVAGGAYLEMYPGITLASPSRYVGLPGLPFDVATEYVTVPAYRGYLDRYAARFDLRPERRTVTEIGRLEDEFSVSYEDGGSERFRFVVVATGMFDHPARPRIEGLSDDTGNITVVHARDWKGPPEGKRILILGGATSAIEISEECARKGIRVVVSTRSGIKILPQRFLGRDLHDYGRIFEVLPGWLLGPYCERRPTLQGTDLGFRSFVREGRIVERGPLSRFEGRWAVFTDGVREEFDVVVLATGYGFDAPFLPPEVARARAGHPRTRKNESVSWPGLFFVGTPCARSAASEFLRGVARDAPLVASEIRGRLMRPRAPIEGTLALAFFLIHGFVLRNDLLSLLSCCNAATALVAAGLLSGAARLAAIGFLWLCIGTPCWLFDLATGGVFERSNLFTHVGGLVVGALGARRLGVPRGTWWRAMAWLIVLQQFSRVVTTPEENVNLAFSVHHSASFLPYPVYYVLLTGLFSLVFLVMERVWKRRPTGTGPRPAPRSSAGSTASP
jgi:putative flavoprotein involved in K+ transport